MVSSRKNSEQGKIRRPPAKTPKAREHQMINLALDQAELQLREGTAATPVVVHYLKLATKEQELREKQLDADIRLREKRIDEIDASAELIEMMDKAIKSMREYQGHDEEQIDDY